MQSPSLRSRLPILPFFPPACRPIAQPIEPVLQKVLIPDAVIAGVEAACSKQPGAPFAASLLAALDIRFEVNPEDVARIPKEGPAVVVANHPHGIVDGLSLMAVLDGRRGDTRVPANSLLAGIPEIRVPLRAAVDWLSGGGLLGVFPAGEVAHANWHDREITDPQWNSAAVRLALRAHCAVIPVYFEGANSFGFHLAGAIHPALRTASLARDFCGMRGKTVQLRVGSPVFPGALARFGAEAAIAYLRARTYFLSNRPERSPAQSGGPSPARARAVAPPGSAELLSEEVAALPADCELASNREFAAYLRGPRRSRGSLPRSAAVVK